MTSADALAAAIAARNAAWDEVKRRFDDPDWAIFYGMLDAYAAAAADLRAICPHKRSEERGYGAPVCVVCGDMTG